MKDVYKLLVGVAIIMLIFWGYNNNNEAVKYKGLYNQNEFILNYLIENDKIPKKEIKTAIDLYEDSQIGTTQDNSPGGQGY